MYQILLVEDDVNIRNVIQEYIEMREDEMELRIAESGDKALEMLYENEYDLVLLDVMLPGTDGFEICKRIRTKKDTPIIFLTARGREEDILRGYDYGCDDYIVKPFSLATLLAKCKALLNRAKGTVLGKEMMVGKITLSPRNMTVTVEDTQIELPPKEYLMLKVLMEKKNAVVTRDELLIRIWGYDYDGDERVIDNHMKKLRKALLEEGKRIKTVIGRGYKIVQ